ncbi:MAG: hypothetical protein R3193_08735 [Marinobacter sp.]|nr:hypothetical protein [Marinobacter sp.]
MTMRDIAQRHKDCWQSFRGLPAWVQVWVASILIPVNAVSFLFLDTESGRWISVAAILVLATNYPIMLASRGMSRLLSVPHLLIWVPLELALVDRVFTKDLQGPELYLVLAVLLMNGISLVFDFHDSWRWIRGEREVPRHL